MLSKFDELVKQRKELRSWLENANKTDSQSRWLYKLRVGVSKPSMIAFCGQAYAGANNYHDAPGFVLGIAYKAIEKEAADIVFNACKEEVDRLTKEINALREEVLREFGE